MRLRNILLAGNLVEIVALAGVMLAMGRGALHRTNVVSPQEQSERYISMLQQGCEPLGQGPMAALLRCPFWVE
jgi:hypothetical protein